MASEYLLGKFKKRTYKLLSIAVGCIILALTSYWYAVREIAGPDLRLIFVLFFIYLLALYLISNTLKFEIYTNSFYRGLIGEHAVEREFRKLKGYEYFGNLHVNGKRSDLDGVLVGPNGVCVVEIKNRKGVITYKDGQLLKDGSLFERDILKQVKGNAYELSQYLKQTCGFEGYIKPIIVFSNKNTKMAFGLKPVDGTTFVIQKYWIKNLLDSFPDFYFNKSKEKVVEALKKLV